MNFGKSMVIAKFLFSSAKKQLYHSKEYSSNMQICLLLYQLLQILK